jgi:hypothetical protein
MPSFLLVEMESFFFVVLGFKFRGSHLAKQVPYHLSHILSPFCSGYSGNGVSRTISPPIFPISASLVARN